MGKYQVIISEMATIDIEEAEHYFSSLRDGYGFEFSLELTNCFELIQQSPRMYPIVKTNKRRAVLKKFNYNIFYIIAGDEVLITRVIHGSRDPSRWSD